MSTLQKTLRVLLVTLVAFLAITAIPGGLALLLGINAPPVGMLQGSPFADFTIPGLTLMVVVGGSAAIATYLLVRRRGIGFFAAGLAGAVVMAFEFVQVLAIGSPAGPARVMQILYFFLGLTLVVASLVLLQVREPAGGR